MPAVPSTRPKATAISLAGLTSRLGPRLALWHRQWLTRRHLATLEPHMLDDIGLTPEDAAREARRPFWR